MIVGDRVWRKHPRILVRGFRQRGTVIFVSQAPRFIRVRWDDDSFSGEHPEAVLRQDIGTRVFVMDLVERLGELA